MVIFNAPRTFPEVGDFKPRILSINKPDFHFGHLICIADYGIIISIL